MIDLKGDYSLFYRSDTCSSLIAASNRCGWQTLQLAALLVLLVCPTNHLLQQLPADAYSHSLELGFHDVSSIAELLQVIAHKVQGDFSKINRGLMLAAAWIGSFPLKLDWLVVWKVYPVTSVFTVILTNFTFNSVIFVKTKLYPNVNVNIHRH
jgi:hypothetical protein